MSCCRESCLQTISIRDVLLCLCIFRPSKTDLLLTILSLGMSTLWEYDMTLAGRREWLPASDKICHITSYSLLCWYPSLTSVAMHRISTLVISDFWSLLPDPLSLPHVSLNSFENHYKFAPAFSWSQIHTLPQCDQLWPHNCYTLCQ